MTATRNDHGRAAHTTHDSDRTVYVVRHAHAGQRSDAPDDERRTLSEQGRREADRIAEVLAPHMPGHIVSSPFVRCVETMRPLAGRLGVDVDVRAELAEGGASPDEAMQLLADLPDRSVACVHGDMLEGLAARLDAGGCPVEGRGSLDKGVVWALAFLQRRLCRRRGTPRALLHRTDLELTVSCHLEPRRCDRNRFGAC